MMLHVKFDVSQDINFLFVFFPFVPSPFAIEPTRIFAIEEDRIRLSIEESC